MGDTGPSGPGISGTINLTSGFGGYVGTNLVQLNFNFASTTDTAFPPTVTVVPANAAAIAAFTGFTNDQFQLTITGNVAASQVLLFNFTITPTQTGG